jgi:hypothetical protein
MSLTFSIDEKTSPPVIILAGPVDESATNTLISLKNLPNGPYIFNLIGLSGINSIGVRNWLNFMKEFQIQHEVRFSNCTVEFIRQVNMIPPFIGKGKIESFFAQFYCETCEDSFDVLFYSTTPLDDLNSSLSSQRCKTCSSISECVESPDEYLRFLPQK